MPVSIDTSNAALASLYDGIPYEALPHPASHPARLATVATFVGHGAPRLESCNVLEVGCNDGSNLIPMAVSLPAARFVGCDLSSRALDAGRRSISALGLTNITLVEGDLAALAPAHGDFDFIVAHGVYSWVPPDVRDALFALAAARLARDGILYVSFNVLPGCRVRQAAWDVLRALIANQPATYEVASVDDRLHLGPLSRPLEDIFTDAYMWGIVDLHVHPPALTIRASDRPVASPLARLQARTRDNVTTLLHTQVGIADVNALRLLPLVDGTRDRAALASAVKQIAVNIDPSRAQDFVNYALEKFARLGLLMPDGAADTSSRQ